MAVLITDFQFEFEPAFPVIEDNNEFDEFAQEDGRNTQELQQ